MKTRRVVNETQKRKEGTEMRRQISQLASNPGRRDSFFSGVATNKVPMSAKNP